MKVGLAIFAIVVAVPGLLAVLHLTVLTFASLAYREDPSPEPVGVRFLVLIPAHDEAVVIGDTLEAVMRDRRSGDVVLVVADRCTDATAAIARRLGALVVERVPGDEPGRGPARQAGLDHASTLVWDAVVMIDADSIVAPGFFDACERALGTGAEALQARSEAATGTRWVEQAALASFAFQGVVIPRGRDRLGLSVRLRGTGMVLRRWIAERYRFRAPASEDLWYGLDLCLAGIRARHVESARLRSANARSWRAASTQKLRNEAGRMSAAREFVGPLLRRHDAASLEAAWFLATPPFAIAALALLLGCAAGAASGVDAIVWVTASGLAFLTLDLVVALVEARVPGRTWLALLIAPWYLLWKAGVQIRALVSVTRHDDYYPPTAREESVPGR